MVGCDPIVSGSTPDPHPPFSLFSPKLNHMKTKWLDIHVDPNTKYESVTFKKNSGAGSIAILPIRTTTAHNGVVVPEVLVRKEITPAWQLTEEDNYGGDHYVAITGLIEPGESPENAARRELLEETGLDVGLEKIPMIWSGFQSKKDKDRHYIFVKRVNGLTPGNITGDGTQLESLGTNHWIHFSRLHVPKTFDSSLMIAYNYSAAFLDI